MPVEDIQDQFMSHALNLNAFANKEARELKVLFSDLSKELSDQINESEIGQMTYRKQKLRALQKQADTTVDSLYNKIYTDQSDVLTDLALSESNATKKLVNKALGVKAMTTTITPHIALQLVSNSIIQGAVQKEWWKNQSTKLKDDFTKQVQMGMLAGESTDEVARRIAGRFNGTYDIVKLKNGKTRRIGQREGGIMNTSFRNAEALARTSIHTVSNNARLATFKENDDVIKGVELIVTLDDRTTPICISRSGGAWDLASGEPLPDSAVSIQFPGPPPYHFRCRSALLPVLKKWDELGSPALAKFKEFPKGQRASMDGLVPADMTYGDWLKKKELDGPEFANKLLGKGKAQLWRDGKITLQQLVDNTGQPFTLKELKNPRISPPVVGPPPPAVDPKKMQAFLAKKSANPEDWAFNDITPTQRRALDNYTGHQYEAIRDVQHASLSLGISDKEHYERLRAIDAAERAKSLAAPEKPYGYRPSPAEKELMAAQTARSQVRKGLEDAIEIEKALETAPVVKDALYRGMGFKPDESAKLASFLGSVEKGSTMNFGAMTSFSQKKMVAHSFARPSQVDTTTVYIHSKGSLFHAGLIDEISSSPGEFEVLVSPKQKFKVVDITEEVKKGGVGRTITINIEALEEL